MTRVLHTGDTHVGYQQYHSPERRQDFLAAFEAVVEDAIAEDVDAVVHAGDLFHDRRPDLPDLQGVVAALRELRDAGIPFLAVVGNHEAKRSGQWLDLFEDLGLAERLGDKPRVVGDLALYGLDHVPESQREDLEYEYAEHDAEHAVLVAHGLFGPFEPANWDTERLLEESTVEFDALLLGDNHLPGTQQVDDTWVTYPGSTERASASERQDRGYNLVTAEADADLRITRRSLDTRGFVFVDVDLAEGEGGEAVRERVREYDHEDAVTIVTIEGDGDPVTPGPIEELAREEGALVARVNDRREIEAAEEELEVSFADPDEAVRQRLSEMGLSAAARDLDRVVRDPDLADANVRESARRRVQEQLDEGLDGFDSAGDPDATTLADELDGESGAESGEDESGEEEPADADDASVVEDDAGDDTGDGTTNDDSGEEPASTDPTESADDDDATADDADASEPTTDAVADASESTDDDTPADDGQASMEEYL